jgi:hypothetical protein
MIHQDNGKRKTTVLIVLHFQKGRRRREEEGEKGRWRKNKPVHKNERAFEKRKKNNYANKKLC